MKQFIEKTSTLITGAFGLVAALAWNETIKTFIQKYISPGKEMVSLFLYAIVVTVVAVFASIYVAKVSKKLIEQDEKIVKKLQEMKNQKEKCEVALDKQKEVNKSK